MKTRAFGWLCATSLMACGGATPPVEQAKAPPPPKPKQAEVIRERLPPRVCPARRKLAELLGNSESAPAADPDQTAASAPPPESTAGAAQMPASQVYRKVAPSTVVIRANQGIGTGVVVDSRGYVLTNHHVVANGQKKDFIITVDVAFGDLRASGRMTKQEKSYDAVVVKTDPIRDLALVKILDAPKNLTAIKLAEGAPQIAEEVMSVGHAGIGFLWAAKTCSVASIGERQQDFSRLAAAECLRPDPSLSEEEAKREKERCDSSRKEMTEALMSTTQGLAVQTDCAMTRGDSGGPLVNARGQLVGLNQSLTADLATAAFHVHLDELREFVTKFPTEAIAVVPDPFCDGGGNTTLEDIDLDGVPDTVVNKGSANFFGGYDRMSLLIDLDQSHWGNSDAEKIFDGEIALLTTSDGTFVWYDTNGDATFDLLLFDKDSDGKPEKAYHIDALGVPKEDPEALPQHNLSGKYIQDPVQAQRLGKIAAAIGATKHVSDKTLAAGKQGLGVPDPVLGGGTEGRAYDRDGNGTVDTAVMRGAFSSAMLIDADEDSLRSFKVGDSVGDWVKQKKIDPELSFISQGENVWALYDTNNDGSFDLVLAGSTGSGQEPALVANHAWLLEGQKRTPAPEHIGRKILRAGLFPTLPRARTILGRISAEIANDEGLDSLPSPWLNRPAAFAPRAVEGYAFGTAISASAGNWISTLIDVDGNSKLKTDPKLAKISKVAAESSAVRTAIDEGRYDAEVAIVRRVGPDATWEYVFYDTDGDGAYDLVLVGDDPSKSPVTAYVVKGGALVHEPSLAQGKFLRHSVFTNPAIARKWKAIAAAMFRTELIEP